MRNQNSTKIHRDSKIQPFQSCAQSSCTLSAEPDGQFIWFWGGDWSMPIILHRGILIGSVQGDTADAAAADLSAPPDAAP